MQQNIPLQSRWFLNMKKLRNDGKVLPAWKTRFCLIQQCIRGEKMVFHKAFIGCFTNSLSFVILANRESIKWSKNRVQHGHWVKLQFRKVFIGNEAVGDFFGWNEKVLDWIISCCFILQLNGSFESSNHSRLAIKASKIFLLSFLVNYFCNFI